MSWTLSVRPGSFSTSNRFHQSQKVDCDGSMTPLIRSAFQDHEVLCRPPIPPEGLGLGLHSRIPPVAVPVLSPPSDERHDSPFGETRQYFGTHGRADLRGSLAFAFRGEGPKECLTPVPRK